MAARNSKKRTGITMQDIADKAGVSKATVSLALRRHPSISEKTSEKVHRVAEALNYKTNPFVATHMATLRLNRGEPPKAVLAFLISHDKSFNLDPSKQHQKAYYEGASDRAKQMGYGLALFSLQEFRGKMERLEKVLRTRGISGVIVSHLNQMGRQLDFNWESFANCAIGDSLIDPNIYRVQTQTFDNVTYLMGKLTRLGFRRIGLASLPTEQMIDRGQSCGGYLNFQRTLAKSDRLPIFYTDQLDKPGVFRKWIEQNRPDAVISFRSSLVKKALQREGVRVPEELSLATMYGTYEDAQNQISGCYADLHAIGAAAIDIVIGQIHRNERGYPSVPRTTTIPAFWKDGATVC